MTTMKMVKMNKYGNIKSLKDLDNEILRLKLKKNIIKSELGNNVHDFKESLKPLNLIKEALGISASPAHRSAGLLTEKDNIFNNGKVFTYLKYLALTVSTVKGGAHLIKRIKSIFR